MPGSTVGLSMNYGAPGTFSRNSYPEIRSRLSDPSSPYPTFFGDAIFRYSNVAVQGGVYRSTQNLSAVFPAISNGTNVLSGITGMQFLWNRSPPQVGFYVIGPGVQLGTTITAIGATTLTLSMPTTTAVSGYFNIVSPAVNASNFAGICLREVKTGSGYYSSTGSGAYAIGAPLDVLLKGSSSVNAPLVDPIYPGAPVYLQIAFAGMASSRPVGSFQTTPDGAYSIALPTMQWNEGLIDSNNVAEISILIPTSC